MNANNEAVAEAMRALGSAIRGDWGSIDGRTIRDSMDALASFLAPDAALVTYGVLCAMVGVCPENRCWPEYCDSVDDSHNWCAHLASVSVR